MFCKKCGSELNQDAIFCSKCGERVVIESPESDQDNSPKQDAYLSNVSSEQIADIKVNFKKVGLALIVIIIIVLIMCMMIFKMPIIQNDDYSIGKTTAMIGKNGSAYFKLMNKVVELNGDYERALVSKDGKRFACLDTDGTLYYYSSETDDKQKIADDVTNIGDITSDGIIFYKEASTEDEADDVFEILSKEYMNGLYTAKEMKEKYIEETGNAPTYYGALGYYMKLTGDLGLFSAYKTDGYKYLFSDKEIIQFKSGTFATNDKLEALVIDEDKNLLIYPTKESEAIDICKVGENATPLEIFDRENVFWCEEIDKELLIYTVKDNDKFRLGSFDGLDHYDIAVDSYNNNKDYIIFAPYSSDSMIIGHENGTSKEMEFKDIIKQIDTVKSNNQANIKDFIVCTLDEEDEYSLYEVSLSGEKNKLVSNVRCYVGNANGRISYIDYDKNLHVGEITGNQIINDIEVAKNVSEGVLTLEGKYIFYSKGDDYTDRTLYYADLTGKTYKTDKIDKKVYRYRISTQDNAVYYVKDADLRSEYTYSGDLYRYEVGGQSSKITSDVCDMESQTGDSVVYEQFPIVLKFSYRDNDANTNYYNLGTVKKGTYEKITNDVSY